MPFLAGTCRPACYVASMPSYARPLIALSLATGLGACASAGADYPSLATRDAERVEGQFTTGEPARIDVPPVEISYEGPLADRLTALVAMAEEAHTAFLEATPRARRTVAAASSSEIGSDAWASAQVALAELDSARSLAAVPLSDLDALYTAARVSVEETAAIEAARSRVITLVSEEDAVLADLRGRIQ